MPITKENIEIKDKAAYINQMFSKIAFKYDLLNNLMTFGCHKRWKKEAIELALKENKSIKTALDICSGTGDLAFILKAINPETQVTCVDNCKEMLEIMKDKIETRRIKNIDLLLDDVDNLSFSSASFDLVTIGFGLRNLVNKEDFISNSFKMLKKDGVLVCIDLGHPENILWQKLFHIFFFKVVPLIGQVFAKNKEAYTYLPLSLTTWYKQNELKNLLIQKGFNKVFYKNILGGIAAIHIAVK